MKRNKQILYIFINLMLMTGLWEHLSGTSCGSAIPIISTPVTGQPIICGSGNDLNSGTAGAVCGSATNAYKNGKEALYSFNPTSSGVYEIKINGISNSAIFVYAGCPISGGVCLNSIGSPASSKTLSVSLTSGTTYYIWFDTAPLTESPCPGIFSIRAVSLLDCSFLSSPSGPVCPGTAITFTASSLSGIHSWDFGDGTTSASGGSVVTHTFAAGGTYTVTHVLNDLGASCTLSSMVTVRTLPVTSFSLFSDACGYNILCYGDSSGAINLTTTGGLPPYTYLWSCCGGVEDPSGLTAGTYTVLFTDMAGCVGADTVVLTEPPALTVHFDTLPPGAGSITCAGGTACLEVAAMGGCPGYSYAWSNGCTSTGCCGLVSGTYSVTAYDANGCTAIVSITLPEPPVLLADAGPDKIVYTGHGAYGCALLNGTTTGGSPPYLYEWSSGSGFVGTASTVLVCPSISGMYYFTVTDSRGCTAEDSVYVCVADVSCGPGLVSLCHNSTTGASTMCVDSSLVAGHLAHGDCLGACPCGSGCAILSDCAFGYFPLSPVCTGTTITFTAISASGSHTWDFGDGYAPVSGGPIMSHSFSSGGTYYVTHTLVVGGITCTDSVALVVNAPPNAIAGPDRISCPGSAGLMLIASGGDTYLWSPATGLSSTTIANPVASPTTTTTFEVTVSVAGCVGTTFDEVTVYVPPPVSAGADVTTCRGDSVPLSASGLGAWSWSPATGLSCTHCPNPHAAPDVTTGYTVTFTDLNGCITTDAVTVVIQPSPSIDLGPDIVGCPGTLHLLNPYPVAGTYFWTPSAGLDCDYCASPTALLSAGEEYIAVYSNGFCTARDTIALFSSLPDTVSFSSTLLSGTHYAFAALPPLPGLYEWNFGDPSTGALNTATGSSPTHSFSGSGVYHVCLTLHHLCGDVTRCNNVVVETTCCGAALFKY